MEERVKQYAETLPGRKYHNRNSLSLIRYADDFVILHEDITVVQRIRDIISEWLKGMGLELKPSKTRIAHTLNPFEQEPPGFDFLGFTIQQFPVGKYRTGTNSKGKPLGFKTIITPSKKKQKVHNEKIASTIKAHKSAPQAALIKRLNPIIRGWAKYYATVSSKETYTEMDYLIYQKLRAWAKHRHPNKSGKWITDKYWQTIGGNNWEFATSQEGKNPLRLLRHAETPIVRHVKVKDESSPHDGNLVYWSIRKGENPEMPNRISKLLKKQKGLCAFCGLYFRENDVMEVDHKIPKSKGGKDSYDNWQLLHRHCHDTKTALDGSLGTQSGCNRAKPKPTETTTPLGRGVKTPPKRIVKELEKWVMRYA